MYITEEKFEYTKGMDEKLYIEKESIQQLTEKGQTTNQTLSKKPKYWATQTPQKGVNSGAPEVFVIPAPLVAPVVLLLLQIQW